MLFDDALAAMRCNWKVYRRKWQNKNTGVIYRKLYLDTTNNCICEVCKNKAKWAALRVYDFKPQDITADDWEVIHDV